MGQYYVPVNTKTKEFLVAFDYQNMNKLMEHSWLGNDFVAIVEQLLSEGQSWHKTPMVWAGDYGDEGMFTESLTDIQDRDMLNLYEIAHKHFTKVKPKLNQKERDESLRYLVNHTQKQYVDLNNLPKLNGVPVHPLPLLTANGNGRGGGDYRGSNHATVGSWAGDIISTEITIPEDYKQREPNFVE